MERDGGGNGGQMIRLAYHRTVPHVLSWICDFETKATLKNAKKKYKYLILRSRAY